MASVIHENTKDQNGVEMTHIAHYLDILHWSAGDLADALNVNRRTVFRWLNGQNDIPESVMDWLRTLAAFHVKNQYPENWYSRKD
jgi:hypothetical protein